MEVRTTILEALFLVEELTHCARDCKSRAFGEVCVRAIHNGALGVVVIVLTDVSLVAGSRRELMWNGGVVARADGGSWSYCG